MKVSEIPYERADAEKVCGVIDKAVEKINAAKSVDDVLEARELVNDALRDFYTESSLANARFTLNTKDEFYSAEKDYYDEKMPVVQVSYLKYADAILRSKFLDELKTKINPVIIKQGYYAWLTSQIHTGQRPRNQKRSVRRTWKDAGKTQRFSGRRL